VAFSFEEDGSLRLSRFSSLPLRSFRESRGGGGVESGGYGVRRFCRCRGIGRRDDLRFVEVRRSGEFSLSETIRASVDDEMSVRTGSCSTSEKVSVLVAERRYR
jgi:hypothetical protein